MMRHYWHVTKPGITGGNLLSVMGGFFLASRGHADFALLLPTAIGICLVIASACVLNNCIDGDLDRMMTRTRERVLARGLMSPQTAVSYAAVLGLCGMALLLAADNLLTVSIVLAGFAIYVGVYSLYLKRRSVHATLIGSLAGAAPPVAGYCAVSGSFDMGAAILLSIFSLWQIPHFYAIAVYRLEDYAAAAIPVLPLKRGFVATRRHIIAGILAFTLAAAMLTCGGYTGYGYLAAVLALGAAWLFMALEDSKEADDHRRWARKLFICSILAISILDAMMAVDFAMPITPG